MLLNVAIINTINSEKLIISFYFYFNSYFSMEKEFETFSEKFIFDFSNFKIHILSENKELLELIKRKNEQYLELEKYNDTLLKSIHSFEVFKTKKELQIQYLSEENLKITEKLSSLIKSHFREIKTLYSEIETLSKYKELYEELLKENKKIKLHNISLKLQIEKLSIDDDPRLP